MEERSILVTIENCESYRLNMYHDFLERLSVFVPNIKVYGEGYDQDDPKFLKTYRPSKGLNEIIKEDLDGKIPDVIFLINANFAPSDFTKIDSKVYVFLSDSVSTNMNHVKTINSHNFKCEGVFHNYLYEQDKICSYFKTTNKFHWPCWASMKYDYDLYKTKKTIDFFMSGTITGEYSYRKTFRDLFYGSDLKYIDKFMTAKNTKDDNEKFLKLLGESRYSPHDGGVNGRMQGRFFESSFMKSVVVAPDLGEEMKVNGFVSGENCVLFKRSTDLDSVMSILRNVDKKYDWNVLSKNAYDLIKSKHTTDVSVKQFLDVVSN